MKREPVPAGLPRIERARAPLPIEPAEAGNRLFPPIDCHGAADRPAGSMNSSGTRCPHAPISGTGRSHPGARGARSETQLEIQCHCWRVSPALSAPQRCGKAQREEIGADAFQTPIIEPGREGRALSAREPQRTAREALRGKMTGALGTDRKMRHPYLLGAPGAVRFIRQGLRWRQRLSEQRELNADRPAPVVLEMGGQIPPLASESRMGA